MTNLSSDAQAVENAYFNADGFGYRNSLAAALRAVADQAHPKSHVKDFAHTHQNYIDGWKDALDVILDIADDLN